MSDLTNERSSGLRVNIVDVGGTSVERARLLLTGIQDGVKKAVGSALARTMTSSEAYAARAVRAEYVVSASTFKAYTNASHKDKKIRDNVVTITYSGHHIPIIELDRSFTKDGHVSVRVKRNSAREVLDHAFTATIGGKTGIYERETEARTPLRQIYGPSTPQMMSANEEVSAAIGEQMRETFDKRMEHEITRLLNGWGGKS